ncbi:condensation domain-containing protein, partial [Paenactinomyces guangxiensis]
KIRGYRIELGEIETRLLEHPSVREAVVTARPDREGSPSLYAYMVLDGLWNVSEIRKHLMKTLPDYMIPSYLVELETLPLTTNGKVDKKALPEPLGRVETGVEYAAPTDPNEKLLAGIWQEVLGIERVGIHDNFFEVGGDSIKAIQIAARLHQQNRKIEMKDLFQYPTIAGLAPFVQRTQTTDEQGMVKGEVTLTPIQRWFFEQEFANPHHWNQAVMLYSKKGWEPQYLDQVFQKLLEHHDALRMVYSRNEKMIVQINRELEEKLFTLKVFDLTQEPNVPLRIKEEADRLQQTLNLNDGPLVKLGLFKTLDGDHLLITIHHLVVDGVSWRILLEDFAAGYQQAVQHKEIRFPDKTSSYQTWAGKLQEYAESSKLLRELPYWKKIEETVVPALPKEKMGTDVYLHKDKGQITVSLSESETKQLLTDVHRAYHTEINDLLLTALGLAVREWTEQDQVLVNMEGHGREELIAGVDVSRTVGWFTSIYPVVLNLKADEIAEAIRNVKEILRKVPNRGIGYGVLKYMTAPEKKDNLTFRLHPEIGFNYLGQFAQEVKTGAFYFSSMPTGESNSPVNHAVHSIELNGAVLDGKLQMIFHYNPHVHRPNTIERLARRYKHYLLELIAHCIRQEETKWTPGDFNAQEELTVEELDHVLEVLGENIKK